jgi:Cu+-exporting ATPase
MMMFSLKFWKPAAALFVTLSAATLLPAADAKSTTDTTITINGMHCEGCAKKIARKLKAVSNVAEVKIDVKNSLAAVSPQKGKSASARALWEAVESAGYEATKLQGPAGTFTSKPKT